MAKTLRCNAVTNAFRTTFVTRFVQRPDQTRPDQSFFMVWSGLSGVQDLHLQRPVTRWSALRTAEAG